MNYHRPAELIGKKEIQLIHVAASKLGLPRDAYEAILLGAAGVDSSKKLTFKGYEAVMRRFGELGFKLFYKEPAPGASRPAKKMRPFTDPVRGKDRVKMGDMASPEQQEKIYALWEDVGRNKTPRGLRGFLFSRFSVSDMRFLDKFKAQQVIEALKSIRKRECRTLNSKT